MNICFLYDGKVLTSPLHGTILDGITRRSVLALVKEMGLEVVERALTVEEIFEGAKPAAWRKPSVREPRRWSPPSASSPTGTGPRASRAPRPESSP